MHMRTPTDKRIWTTWSGGIDSTALVGKLLQAGYTVFPIAILMGSQTYQHNEEGARKTLSNYFKARYPRTWIDPVTVSGAFLKSFSPDGGQEVPRRNKHIMDFVMMNYVIPNDLYYIGMGSHLGADTPAVDHLHGNDTDSRHMNAYLLSEYGIGYQLMSCLDFGPSRYKTDRIEMMLDSVTAHYAFATYNCLDGVENDMHCGQCYKCVERHAAFESVLGDGQDKTRYVYNPKAMSFYEAYLGHFNGTPAGLSWEEISIGNQGSHKED